jgi:hypothetical protein
MTDVFVGFIDQKVREEYDKVRSKDPQLFRFLKRATNDLKKDPLCGIKIPKNLWPKEYVREILHRQPLEIRPSECVEVDIYGFKRRGQDSCYNPGVVRPQRL